MNIFGVMDVSGSALKAERVRAEVVASNMANAETTRTPEGGPYQRHHVVFEAQGGGTFQDSMTSQINSSTGQSFGFKSVFAGGLETGMSNGLTAANLTPGGVEVTSVIADASKPLQRYDPQHPDAGPDGFVAYPDINPLTEMVDLMGATRSYGMNASAITAEKGMFNSSLDLLK
ncbi:flagellar basal body rod protein FlgC [Tunturiibacter lichenicola]|uniref:flagellar basal body rod protein FlgC n=1 Tax=Tunturiibacter lichenicola TaxID=2051959 RepID=UPI0021B32EDC|nr:flagellar basal body rod protein FlgC [Edaphobacter lichenicola]